MHSLLRSSARLALPRPAALARGSWAPSTLRLLSTPAPPPELDDGEKNIFAKLTDTFAPSELQVQDVSGASTTLRVAEHPRLTYSAF
jgi:hypothetical protein